jgi:hypothetical protein
MESYLYRYVSIAHSEPGAGVMFILERMDGSRFGVALTAEDAERLVDDLREQIRIAKSNA